MDETGPALGGLTHQGPQNGMMGQREPFALISLKAEGTVSKSPARSASIAPLQWRLAISPTRTQLPSAFFANTRAFMPSNNTISGAPSPVKSTRKPSHDRLAMTRQLGSLQVCLKLFQSA